MALGSQAIDAVALVTRQTLGMVGIGLLLGLPLAFASARAAQALLYGVSATDPWALLGTSVVLITAGLAATIVPARRAATVDPLVALREE